MAEHIPSIKTRRRHNFEKTLVWLKYCSPAILTLASWFFCLVKCVRFHDGKTVYSLQSVNEMVSAALAGIGSFDAAKDDSYTELLAGALKPATTAYVLCFVIAGVLALYLLVFACLILAGDPMSPHTNRAKVWFKTFFPGKWLVFISLLLPVYPTFMPYVIRHLFYKYYVMNDLSVIAARFNPAIAASFLCVIFLVLFFAAIPLEKRHRMDPFKRYDKEEDD
ncbi:MAG: hypothetical protein II319_04720 [Clostridia bacterium]|nr:hypothetical protein [Clostridia bacterium]